ncbi:MAG: hypothetical protein ABIE22_02295, partial [archaeon]
LVNISANDDNLDSVWWYNGSNNLTYASELIYTFQQGSNTIFAYANDTFGNLNQTSITFSVDFIPPLIEIVYPANFSYSRDITELNYTVDSTAESCWYSLNDGVNITMICGENLTSLMSSEGSNTWRIYSNDSTGNVNISSVTFLKDTISPTVVIEIPESLIYGYNDSLGLNYSIFEDNSIDACWYNLDNEDNITLTNCQNATFNVSDGSHILYLYSNDTLGNEGFDSVSFSVVTTAPALNIIAPKNNSYINLEEIYFNYSVTSGLALDTCELWGNFIGLWEKNQSDDSIEYGYNFFILNLSDGNYDGGVICNDSQNRISGVNSTFTVDTLNPLVTLTQPVGTKTSRTSIPIAFTLTELNTNTCWYNVYRGLTLEISNTTVNCSQTSSFDVTVDASFILNFYANDSAGNINYTHSSFTVSTVLADDDDDSGGGSGGGGGGGGIAPVVEDVKIKISARLISDLTMRAGEQKTMTVDITNEDNTFFNDCKLVADKLSWISSVATEDIAQGQEISFPFTLKIPNSADTGKKDLGLKLKCKEGEADISFVVDVIESSLVVEIKSIEEDSGIINVDYIIKENSGVDQEVNIRLWLTDTEGLTLTEGTDIASLKAGEEIEKEVIFEIPPESVGEFIINIEVTSGDTVNLVTDSIILGGGLGLAGRAIFGGGNSSIISIVLIVVLGVIFAFFIVKRIIKNSAKEDRSGYVKVKLGKNKRKH